MVSRCCWSSGVREGSYPSCGIKPKSSKESTDPKKAGSSINSSLDTNPIFKKDTVNVELCCVKGGEGALTMANREGVKIAWMVWWRQHVMRERRVKVRLLLEG